MTFKPGERVVVTDEKEARRTGANVRLGDKGIIAEEKYQYDDDDYWVIMRDGTRWVIPTAGLSKVEVSK